MLSDEKRGNPSIKHSSGYHLVKVFFGLICFDELKVSLPVVINKAERQLLSGSQPWYRKWTVSPVWSHKQPGYLMAAVASRTNWTSAAQLYQCDVWGGFRADLSSFCGKTLQCPAKGLRIAVCPHKSIHKYVIIRKCNICRLEFALVDFVYSMCTVNRII